MDSFSYRNSDLFLRNNFESDNALGIPLIHKQGLPDEDIKLISYSDTSYKDVKNIEKGVHFFIDDWRFEKIYDNPEKILKKIGKYKFLLTPDYSLYAEMPLWRQIENVAKARYVGAKWQSKGMLVFPTVSWSLSRSYEFCFSGIEKGSIVAVGMIGCKTTRLNFLRGYEKMLNIIEPEKIIVYGKPFKEMEGDIIEVDYLESRKVLR